jgi:predicted negative regulator of RcsB-dependent stress response
VDNETKRQLKQPDQFHSLTDQGVAWASQNRQRAVVAIVAVVVLILAIVGGYSLYEHRTAQAQTAFGAAMQTYQTPIATPDQPLPPGMKSFQDAKTRAQAANPQFLAVANQYGMTEPGKLALYFAGLTYIDEGENASAESTLKKVAGSWNGDVSALAKLALAQLYQQTGRNTDAVPIYNELAKGHATTVPPGLAQLQLAELYTSEGKTVDANKIYADLKDHDKDAKGQPGPAGEIASQKLSGKK